jgi:hypothetical protein
MELNKSSWSEIENLKNFLRSEFLGHLVDLIHEVLNSIGMLIAGR